MFVVLGVKEVFKVTLISPSVVSKTAVYFLFTSIQRGGALKKSIVLGDDLSIPGQMVATSTTENSLLPFSSESEFEKTRAIPLPIRTKTRRAAVILVLFEWLTLFRIGRRVFLTTNESY